MSYYINVSRADLIDPWLVGFIAALILIHLREAKDNAKNNK